MGFLLSLNILRFISGFLLKFRRVQLLCLLLLDNLRAVHVLRIKHSPGFQFHNHRAETDEVGAVERLQHAALVADR